VLGGYDHLKRAIELQPGDELARRKLVVSIFGRASSATHELPTGYLGVALEDLAILSEAEGLSAGLSSGEERQKLAAEIVEQRALIQEYLRKKQQG
jgi:hypothetical protein